MGLDAVGRGVMSRTYAQGCVARVRAEMPAWDLRQGERCVSAPSHYPRVGIVSELVLPLCSLHYEQLKQSPDAASLARGWASGCS
jgi:hypothetical protein